MRACSSCAAPSRTAASRVSPISIIPVPATSSRRTASRGNTVNDSPSPRPPLRAPRGTALSCRSWLTEAPLRMLMNNLDPEVAERWQDLVVYGGIGKAARNWECYEAIVKSLRELESDHTLLVQSGKPVGIFKTHPE